MAWHIVAVPHWRHVGRRKKAVILGIVTADGSIGWLRVRVEKSIAILDGGKSDRTTIDKSSQMHASMRPCDCSYHLVALIFVWYGRTDVVWVHGGHGASNGCTSHKMTVAGRETKHRSHKMGACKTTMCTFASGIHCVNRISLDLVLATRSHIALA